MRVNRLFCFFSMLVLLVTMAKITIQLSFWVIPVFFFVIGLAVALRDHQFAIFSFVFLFPFINASPALFYNGYPFNYMAAPLFLLGGIVVANVVQRLREKDGSAAGVTSGEMLDKHFFPYYIFLGVLLVSTIFVLLRWSNITVEGVGAIGADTPTAPPAPDIAVEPNIKWREQRISFATIFPVVSLFIYFISPYIFFFIRKVKPDAQKLFAWLSYGFYISVGLAVVQKISGQSLISDRLGKDFKQFYGGFSDFNAFGFFSGVMFLWATYEIKKKSLIGYVTLVVGLTGGILSGSRTVFFFILAGIINLIRIFLFSSDLKQKGKQGEKQKRLRKITATLVIVGILAVIFLAGGTLTKRLSEGFSGDKPLFHKLNAITNGRLWMSLFTLETIEEHVVPGVGTGNFTLYLTYKNYLQAKVSGEKYLYDLTLNHYLLVFAENGVLGFVFFTFFMLWLYRRTSRKLLMGTILFSLLFNNFFWFPEAFLLFWIIAALYDREPKTRKKPEQKPFFRFTPKMVHVSLLVALLIFTGFNLMVFKPLHPLTWAKETGIQYDYGFWYPEKDKNGSEFRWTLDKAGIYLRLNEKGESLPIKLFCGAPLKRLRRKAQHVKLYWKGKVFKEVTFQHNNEVLLQVKDEPGVWGFLELEVTPTFNEKKLNISEETRDLGVRFYFQ